MSNLARQYSIMEVKGLLNSSEGQGPGVGGHAMLQHGHLRTDVTDRNKPNDSAFQKQVQIFGKRLVAPDKPGKPSRPVPPIDQAMVVCMALNSGKGQEKLRLLDTKADTGSFNTAFTTEMQGLGNVLPQLRIGHGSTSTSGTLPKIHIVLYKIDGKLHIHTAYAQA